MRCGLAWAKTFAGTLAATSEAAPPSSMSRRLTPVAANGSGQQVQCDSFVIKPCLPDTLVAEVKKVLAARAR